MKTHLQAASKASGKADGAVSEPVKDMNSLMNTTSGTTDDFLKLLQNANQESESTGEIASQVNLADLKKHPEKQEFTKSDEVIKETSLEVTSKVPNLEGEDLTVLEDTALNTKTSDAPLRMTEESLKTQQNTANNSAPIKNDIQSVLNEPKPLSEGQLTENKIVDLKTVKSEFPQKSVEPEIKLSLQKNGAIEQSVKAQKTEAISSKASILNNEQLFKQHVLQPKNVKNSNYAKTAHAEKSLFTPKVDIQPTQAPLNLEGKVSKSTNLQEIMYGKNLDADTVLESLGRDAITEKFELQTNNTVTKPSNVFNMSDLKGANTTEEVITKIQDYIIQNRVDKNSQVEMSFKHHELGKIDVLVQKGEGQDLTIKIATQNIEGHKFFQAKQGQLLQVLSQQGIQVADFKLETSAQSNSQFSQNSFGQDGKSNQFMGQKGQHQSENGQREHESQNRQNLWKQFYEQDVA